MAYLTYSEYTEFGGTVSESAFANSERVARRKLDYFTQDRLKTATIILSEVKECMVEFINKLSQPVLNGNITSYSNGIESFSYGENQNDALQSELYRIAVEFLPVELITSDISQEQIETAVV